MSDEETPVEEAPEEEVSLLDEEPDPEDKYFDKEYVTKLRAEAANYRTKYAKFRDTFESFDDNEVEYLLGVVEQLATDLPTGAKQLRDLAANILEDEFLTGTKWEQQLASITGEEPEEESEEEDTPLTRAEIEKLLEEQAEKMTQAQYEAEIEAGADEIEQEAKELGFEPGTEAYNDLLNFALTKTEGDLQAAAAFARKLHDMEEPEEVERVFPKTASVGKVGTTTAPADTELESLPPLERARVRMERRLAKELGA